MNEQLVLWGDSPAAAQASIVNASHSHSLVLLSLLVALISSSAAFSMVHINRQAKTVNHRRVSLLCSSMVLGLGIWAMHFIGMLAVQFAIPAKYNTAITALSIFPGIGAAFLALRSFQQEPPSYVRNILSGIAVGIGIAATHYSGIAALEVNAAIQLNWPLFVLSLCLGLLLAVLAFQAHSWIFPPSRVQVGWLKGSIPAMLMTAAIASMHYVSMHAMQLEVASVSPPAFDKHNGLSNNTELSLLVAAVATTSFLIFGLTNALLRYRDLWKTVAAQDARLHAMIETAPDGVVTIDEQGLIQEFNAQAQRVFGYRKEEVMGRNIACLMPSPLAEQHDTHLHKHTGKPDKPITVNGREVLGKHKDGRLIPLQLAVGKAITPSGTIFVGYLQDISERKRIDASLRIAASVFEHVREGVAIVDANYNISDVNPAFLRLVEKTRTQCIGRPLESLYDDVEIAPDMSKLWQTVVTKHYWQSESLFTRSDGSVWIQRLSISPVLNELKRPHHFIAVISDVSERAGLEAMLSPADLRDQSTGLTSSKLFMDRLNNSLLATRNKPLRVGLLLVRIKAIATHAKGCDFSATLALAAHSLEQQLRNTDTVASYGENQLAILLSAVKDPATFDTLIERLTASLLQNSDTYASYGVSGFEMGKALSNENALTAQDLFNAAKSQMVVLSVPPALDVTL